MFLDVFHTKNNNKIACFLIPIVLVQSASAKWYEYLAERCISDANQTTQGSKQRFTLSYAHMGYLRTR